MALRVGVVRAHCRKTTQAIYKAYVSASLIYEAVEIKKLKKENNESVGGINIRSRL